MKQALAYLVLSAVFMFTVPALSSDESLIINSWGGSFQDLQSEYVIETFAEESGVSVKQLSDAEAMFARAKLQVEAGDYIMDVMMGDASWLSAGKAQGLWAPIDTSIVPVSSLHPDAVDSHGVAALFWSFNIVSNSELVSDEDVPANWAEVWAFAKENPGRVALFGARPNYVLEVALMADGVEPEDVYPLDDSKIARAFASLERIRDKVIWYESGDQAQRMLSSTEALVAMFYGGDTFQLIDQGVPLRLNWNQGILTRDYWLVLVNAGDPRLAQEFIAHASSPEVQAAFARATGFGPSNPASDALLQDISERMPTFAGNREKQLAYDHEWWGPREVDLMRDWLSWLNR